MRDGTIELAVSPSGYVVRSTKNDQVDQFKEVLLKHMESAAPTGFRKRSVELSGFPDTKTRSKFFYDLVTGLPGFSLRDVTAVFVYKPKPDIEFLDVGADADEDGVGAHVERVHLRGSGVSRSELLRDLLAADDYYITRIGWRSREILGKGYEFDLEALFTDPITCTGFSYLVGGVRHVELGRVSQQRRSPDRAEIDSVSKTIESRARELIVSIHGETNESTIPVA